MSAKFKVEQFLDRAGVDKGIFTAEDEFYSEFLTFFTLGWGNAYTQKRFCIDDEALIHMFTKVFRAFSSCIQGDDYAGFKTLNFLPSTQQRRFASQAYLSKWEPSTLGPSPPQISRSLQKV